MASQQEKCSYTTTEIKIQKSSRSVEQEGFVEQQQFNEKCSNKDKAVEESDRVAASVVLAPVPVSCIPMGTGLGFEEQAHGSSVKHRTESTNVGIEIGQQPALANGENNKRKRTTIGTDGEVYFQLSKFLDGSEEYILEMHDVQSGDVQTYHVMLENKDSGKWSLRVHDLEKIEDYSFFYLMEEDPSPPIFHRKYNLPLLERLNGWTLEKRKRDKGKEEKLEKQKHANNIQDKFYYHQSRQFRSLVEVTGFLLYSSKPKDLKPLTSIMEVLELREEEATTTMAMLSHVETSNTIMAKSSKEIAPQIIVEEAKKNCFSSNAPINDLKGILNLEMNKNEEIDTEEEFLQFLNNSFEDEERRLAQEKII